MHIFITICGDKMKRVFLIILIIIFNMSINAFADVNIDSDENYIDIGLFYGGSAKSSVTLTCYGNAQTINAADVETSVRYDSDGIIAVDGKEYRGSIILSKDGSGLLTVINRVNMEDYISSVIAVEMSPSFNLEALKAQAVCARTYAIKNRGKHSKYGFDLCTTEDCQVYRGVSAESEKCTRAANETEGLVITYNGAIIDAVYSATSGGWTEDVENVWGSEIPYLCAVEDKYESKDVYGSSWSKEISVSEATEIMDKKGYGLGTVNNIQVVSATEHGAVTELKVTGTQGEKVFKKENCRLAFGTATLSQAFSVTPVYESTAKADVIYFHSGQEIPGKISVLSADGLREISAQGVFLKGNTEKEYYANANASVKGFKFEGRGYGHLVGMSQNGANGMASAGYMYDEILKHYYKGIEIS